mgnify:CR=1 FL=1
MHKRSFFLTLLTTSICITSCTSFSKLAEHNKFKHDDFMMLYYNESLNLQSHTMGDFKFANNKQEFKKLNNKKPAFKNILLYAKTYYPSYEYYILLNAKPITNTNFFVKDTMINNNRITLAVSKNNSEEDFRVIASKLATMKSTSSNEGASK